MSRRKNPAASLPIDQSVTLDVILYSLSLVGFLQLCSSILLAALLLTKKLSLLPLEMNITGPLLPPLTSFLKNRCLLRTR